MFEGLFVGTIAGLIIAYFLICLLVKIEKRKKLREEMLRKFCAKDRLIYYETLEKWRKC